jgi:hypothetical protein
MAKKKYFYIERQDKRGRKIYYNQDNKRVSKAKVVQDKKKVFIEVQATQKSIKKGTLIGKREAKKLNKAPKIPKSITGSQMSIKNIYIKGFIDDAITKKYFIFSELNGQRYGHETEESKVNLLLFNYELQAAFYDRMGPFLDSPFFNVGAVISQKKKIFFIDWDSIQLDGGETMEDIDEAFEFFLLDLKAIGKKYY